MEAIQLEPLTCDSYRFHINNLKGCKPTSDESGHLGTLRMAWQVVLHPVSLDALPLYLLFCWPLSQ